MTRLMEMFDSSPGQKIRIAVLFADACRVLFQHPGSFETVSAHRARDICLQYPLPEDAPLQAAFYVVPKDKLQPVLIKGAVHQKHFVFPFAGLKTHSLSGMKSVPDLMLQLVLPHAHKAQWPTPISFLNCSKALRRNRIRKT